MYFLDGLRWSTTVFFGTLRLFFMEKSTECISVIYQCLWVERKKNWKNVLNIQWLITLMCTLQKTHCFIFWSAPFSYSNIKNSVDITENSLFYFLVGPLFLHVPVANMSPVATKAPEAFSLVLASTPPGGVLSREVLFVYLPWICMPWGVYRVSSQNKWETFWRSRGHGGHMCTRSINLCMSFSGILILRVCRYWIFADMPIRRYWWLPICRNCRYFPTWFYIGNIGMEFFADSQYADIGKKRRYADIADADMNIGTALILIQKNVQKRNFVATNFLALITSQWPLA